MADEGIQVAETPSAEPAYVVRGKQTQVRQRALKERLERFHAALTEALKRDAPNLLRKLEPPPPSKSGYQLLPRIVPDAPLKPPAMPQVVWFSWGWSDTLIGREMTTLDRLEADLAKGRVVRRASLAALVDDYKKIIDHRRQIDADIDYNWFWQAAIARDRRKFDRLTKLLDDAVDQQKNKKPLTSDVISALAAVDLPAFVSIESPANHRRIVRVPLSTDITDASFVQSFKMAVENHWRAQVGEENFRVVLDVETISPRRLYCPPRTGKAGCFGSDRGANPDSPPDAPHRGDISVKCGDVTGGESNCSPPRKGEKIDLDAHVARFPKGRAVLTSGAASLRIVGGATLVVSPHDVAPRVLAHEFGHILGFSDAYFRGYRDLGPEGFQIMEYVPDPSDLMAGPSSGVVLARHFEKLIVAWDVQALMQAGLNALYQKNAPIEAAERFRDVLRQNPTHYGATLQLAKALDKSGKPVEALVWWKKILEMAEAAGDAETTATARTRLAREP